MRERKTRVKGKPEKSPERERRGGKLTEKGKEAK